MAGGEGMSWWSGSVKNEEASAALLTKSVTPTEHQEKDAAWVEWERQRKASVRPKVRTNRVKENAYEPLMTEYVGYWANGKEPVLAPDQDQEKCRRASRYRKQGLVQQKDVLEDTRYLMQILNPPEKQAKQIGLGAGASSLFNEEVEVEAGAKKKVEKEQYKAGDKPISKSASMEKTMEIAMLYACSLQALDDPSEVMQSMLEDLSVAYDGYVKEPVIKGKPE